MTPSNKQVQALFDRLGNTIPVDDFNLTMKMGVVSCVMGDFYQHQQAVFEWLTEAGISKEAATQGVASFVNTFNFASLQAEGQGKAGRRCPSDGPAGCAAVQAHCPDPHRVGVEAAEVHQDSRC